MIKAGGSKNRKEIKANPASKSVSGESLQETRREKKSRALALEQKREILTELLFFRRGFVLLIILFWRRLAIKIYKSENYRV